jgi:excisionase family DNA binding protein
MAVETATAEPLLIDLRQAAVLIGISLVTAKRMAAAGELPGLRRLPKRRAVRVVLADLKRWIEDGCHPAGAEATTSMPANTQK